MKICLISQNASPGILIFRKDFISYLVCQGYEVYAFAIDYDSQSRKLVEDLGAIPVDYKLCKTGLNPFNDLRDTWYLSQQLRKIAPDVVLSFFVKPTIYGTIAARLAGVKKRICMLEGLGYIHTKNKNRFPIKKLILQRIHGLLVSVSYFWADKVLFLNADDPVDLANTSFLHKDKLVVFGPIGLNLEDYPYRELDLTKPMRFIFIARLLEEKGIFEYLEASRYVKRKYPEVEFVVLGGIDSNNPSALSTDQLGQLVDEGVVIFPGHVPDVTEWISDSHVFVLPSYREGFPRSTQEAMSIGRAVITTDVPGCRDTVVDGVNGFIVPPMDVISLVNKMLYMIENPSVVESMGLASHGIAVNNYDVKKINKLLAEAIFEK